MKIFTKLPHLAINVILAALWAVFLLRHLQSFLETHSTPTLLFMAMESVVIILFLFRRTPKSVSHITLDWAVAVGGTLAGLLFVPVQTAVLSEIGVVLLSTGSIVAILSYISLNRSYGIVAANRGVKQTGLYRFIRHPIYLSYIIIYGGYILAHTSSMNLIIYAVIITSVVLRIVSEEKHLMKDLIYLNYMKICRWRLIPYVF